MWQGSVTTVSVDHRDERYAGSAARQQTATAVVTTVGLRPSSPSSSPPPPPAAAAASRDACKHRSSAETDSTNRAVSLRSI